MTLVFRPTPEQQALLPLGDSFELTLCGVVKDSSVQVSMPLLMKHSLMSLHCKWKAWRAGLRHLAQMSALRNTQ